MSSNDTASAAAAAAAAAVNFDLVVGPLLIGTVVNAFVFGVCFMQFIEYLTSGYKDNWKLITLLYWVVLIDIYQTGSTVALMWHYVVDNFANVSALGASPWTYATLPIFGSLYVTFFWSQKYTISNVNLPSTSLLQCHCSYSALYGMAYHALFKICWLVCLHLHPLSCPWIACLCFGNYGSLVA